MDSDSRGPEFNAQTRYRSDTLGAGCTSVKRQLLRLAGVPDSVDVHSGYARNAISVRNVLGKASHELLQSTFPATRAMVARHPLERLVSGYKDKFRNGGQVTGIWATYMTRHRKRRGFDTSNMTLPFPQFLEMVAFIMEASGRSHIDRHFRPTTLLCSPCSVKYEYILHTGTLTEDIQYIMNKLNVDISLPFNKTRAPYENYYKDIPGSLMKRIYILYKDDFLINNFTVTPFLRGAIQDDSV
ncbi:carbohydrate sulfotransferase 10-like [Penaeus indicus]|uniref:carbohydrate sulfotransferase 10-like n=1 Tax=Penaeus indicus TaxID=29960 RepID=UPI00300DA42A